MSGFGSAYQAVNRAVGIGGRVVGCGLIVATRVNRGQMLTGVISRSYNFLGFEFAILPLKPRLREKQFQTLFVPGCS
jgi:hypothetical protein